MNSVALLTTSGLFLLLLAGCSQGAAIAPRSESSPTANVASSPTYSVLPVTPSPGRPTGDLAPFLAQLRSRGVTVEQVAEAQQPFLRSIGLRLRLSGGPLAGPVEIDSYAYDRPTTAADDAARVQPDTSARWTEPNGNVKTASFMWAAPPHFFQRDTILALYAGTEPTIQALLTDLLGPQFAGR